MTFYFFIYTIFYALQKYRLGKQAGKDFDEGCKDGTFIDLNYMALI